MPMLRIRREKVVYHIGHLDRPRSERAPTFDGPGIAVTTSPEDWRAIAGLNGPQYRLEFKPAEWVDALRFGKEDIDEIIIWMLNQDYMRPVMTYQVEVYDEDKDEFVDFTFLDPAQAAAKAGRSSAEEAAAAERGEGAVMAIEGYELRPRCLARLGGVNYWPDRLRWLDAAILIWTREVVCEKRDFVVGVWWGEPLSIENKLAGYGILLPERAHLFDVEDEETGESKSFKDTFPECPDVLGPEDLRRMKADREAMFAQLMEVVSKPRR